MSAAIPRRLSEAVVYACNTIGDELFPVVVWLTVFGTTRVAPSLILRLSMAVPQSMDFPRLLLWRRRRSTSGGGVQLSADELSAQLAEWINQTPSGSSRSFAPLSDLSSSAEWTKTSGRISEVLVSLLTYPQRLAAYALFQHRQRSASTAAAGGMPEGGRPVIVRLLLRLVTSFTSTWVHATGNMVFDTVVTYMSTRMGSWGSGGGTGFALGNGGPGRGGSSRHLSSGWRDLLIASCVSTSLNFLLQTYWVEALTSVGELRTQAAAARRGPTAGAAGRPEAEEGTFTHLLLSTLSRLGSKDTLYRLGRMALQPQSSPAAADAPSSPPRAAAASPSPSASPPSSPPPPARVYICGGNSFVFALSGFRFALYRDPQQLTTAASNCITDALDLLLRQARQRAAAQTGHASSAFAFMDGQLWQPPVSTQASGLATSNDVVLSPASSPQLLPLYLVNFTVGAGVGAIWRERRYVLAAGRRVPVIRQLLEVVCPQPPPPLRLPDALQELSPECHVLLVYASGEVEVMGEEAMIAAPLVKPEVPAASLPSSSPRPSQSGEQRESAAHSPLPQHVRARIVAAQELFCPIKRTLMCDPVQTVDGFTYDRDGIEEWLGAHDTAPLTNLHLDSTAVRVNWEARRHIEELVAQYAAVLQAV